MADKPDEPIKTCVILDMVKFSVRRLFLEGVSSVKLNGTEGFEVSL